MFLIQLKLANNLADSLSVIRFPFFCVSTVCSTACNRLIINGNIRVSVRVFKQRLYYIMAVAAQLLLI